MISNSSEDEGDGKDEGKSLIASGPGFLGVLMLNTRFPRPPGDIGHAATFSVPTRYRVIEEALPERVVQSAAALRAGRLPALFVSAVRELESQGALAITTSCGFLVLLQKQLQAAVQVPVVTSSLLRLPALLAGEPQVGVLTISSASLGAEHLLAAGVPADRLGDVVVQGVDPSGEFASAILGNRSTMDATGACDDVVYAALALKQQRPALQTLVLECTNMPPYRRAIEEATGLATVALIDDPRLTQPWQSTRYVG